MMKGLIKGKTQTTIVVIAIAFMVFEAGAIVYSFNDLDFSRADLTLTVNGGTDYYLTLLTAGFGGPPPASEINGDWFVTDMPDYMKGKTVNIDVETDDDLVRVWGIINWNDRYVCPKDVVSPDFFTVLDVRTSLDNSTFYLPVSENYILLAVYRYTPVLHSGEITATVTVVE